MFSPCTVPLMLNRPLTSFTLTIHIYILFRPLLFENMVHKVIHKPVSQSRRCFYSFFKQATNVRIVLNRVLIFKDQGHKYGLGFQFSEGKSCRNCLQINMTHQKKKKGKILKVKSLLRAENIGCNGQR